MNNTVCVVCAEPLPSWARADRRTCSTRCRVNAWRRVRRTKTTGVGMGTTPSVDMVFTGPTRVTSAQDPVRG